jgi:catechol 2,3-dioxygenase-like lactoylglutathione lyase family enzyme
VRPLWSVVVAIATFKDLVLDAGSGDGDAVALATFWRKVLGGRLVDLGDGSARVDTGAGIPIWVDPVPEKRGKGTRVHLDVRLPARDPKPLVAAGATLLRKPGGDIKWWVLADPEGNEFCAFPPRRGVPTPLKRRALAAVDELVVGAKDAPAQAIWWASVLGGTAHLSGDGGAHVAGAAGLPWDHLVFDKIPWRKRAKNRMHWDVTLTDPTPERLVAAGATVLREPGGGISWWVMADLEGNEFCAFAPSA